MPLPPTPPAIVRPLQVAQAQQLVVVEITIKDALAVGDILSPADKALTIYVQAPADLLPNGQLSDEHKAQLLKRLYGPNWESGNEDGSKYVVLSYDCAPVPADIAGDGTWQQKPGAWLYQIAPDGSVQKLGSGYVPK